MQMVNACFDFLYPASIKNQYFEYPILVSMRVIVANSRTTSQHPNIFCEVLNGTYGIGTIIGDNNIIGWIVLRSLFTYKLFIYILQNDYSRLIGTSLF